MLRVDARAAKFNQLRAQRLEAGEIKFLRAIVAKIFPGVRAGLQAVGADDALRRQMLDEQVVAHRVEWVGVEAGGVGLFEAFVEFEVEDFEAERLRGADFIRIPRESRRVVRRGADEEPERFKR